MKRAKGKGQKESQPEVGPFFLVPFALCLPPKAAAVL
jgi:hypothetical protein